MFNSLASKLAADNDADRTGLISAKSELLAAFAVVAVSSDAFNVFGVDVDEMELFASKLIRGRWPGKWLIM